MMKRPDTEFQSMVGPLDDAGFGVHLVRSKGAENVFDLGGALGRPRRTRVRFRGVIDFGVHIFGGEDGYRLPHA